MKLSLNLPDYLVQRLRSDAEALCVSLPVLVTAELQRAHVLARAAAAALALTPHDRAAIAHALAGVETMRLLDGRDELPTLAWLTANLEDAERGDLADRLRGAGATPLALWGLIMEARQQ